MNKSGKLVLENTKEDIIIEQLDKLLKDKKETN